MLEFLPVSSLLPSIAVHKACQCSFSQFKNITVKINLNHDGVNVRKETCFLPGERATKKRILLQQFPCGKENTYVRFNKI